MRIDTRLERQGLTDPQLFFIECWLSLTNKGNIDSDRVTYNNPLNAVEELIELYALGSKHRAPQKRISVAIELLEYLKSDPCLQHQSFESIPAQLKQLLSSSSFSNLDHHPLEKQQTLVFSFLTQLRGLLHEHYRLVSIEYIRGCVSVPVQLDPGRIYSLTNNLVSTLNTMGMPLSECFLLGRNFFLQRRAAFNTAFNQFQEKITLPAQRIRISLKLQSQKLFKLLDGIEGDLTFNECSFHPIRHENKNTVAVNIHVDAISYAAGYTSAHQILNRSLDIMATITGQEKIVIQRFYQAEGWGRTKNLRDASEKPINVLDRLQSNDFNLYMKTMGRVYAEGTESTVKKVSSSMGFLHKGLKEGAPENRFTSLWSALESITEGVSLNNIGHDEHVLLATLPCIGLDYPVKQLFSLRGVAKKLEWGPLGQGDDKIDLKSANLATIYQAIKRDDIKTEINANLNRYPYALFRFGQFIKLCQDPYKLGIKIQKHMDKVELQIHRIYRTRNAIVHNALTHDRLDLLCVNLEHYLRGTLNAMVYMMEHAPTIITPEEAFTRYQFLTRNIIGELDPSYVVREKQKEGLRKQIENGNQAVADSQLISWLQMHG